MGWMDNEGLDTAEEKLIKRIGKTRHRGTCGHGSDSEDDPDKENQKASANRCRNKALIESSDDDYDQSFVEKATPKAKTASQKPLNAANKDNSNVLVVSSDSDGTFESFLERVKTPNVKTKKISKSGSEDSLKNFIVDDFSSDDDFIKKSSFRVPKSSKPPAALHSVRRPLSQCDSPVFVSDGDEDDDIVIKSSWRTRHSKPRPLKNANKDNVPLDDQEGSSPALPPISSLFALPTCKTPAPLAPNNYSDSVKRTHSVPCQLDESASSDEEFTFLLERLKRKNMLTGNSFSSKNIRECHVEPLVPVPAVKGLKASGSRSLGEMPLGMTTPGKFTISKPKVSQTEPRPGPSSRVVVCKTAGCFLQSLTNPGSSYGHHFKQNKEELTSKLFQLYNTSVFDNKLPISMSVTWNKKMRKTAGYCVTGQERGGGSRYARIELSEKVCDSADRLRDTLIHEMCHAATWLINGVRDGHGTFWKLYARKATLVHPELPIVTRCHSYDIKYKYQYQCSRCQNTIGRHSKSLDTQRFVCAICTGQLVLLRPSKPRAPTPFANFVKENYGNVRQELTGQSHADVMRKLSADFATKTKLSQS
ncbi:hypothetical protein LDENG_00023720 [Lucifuga dentata]|nr:hypothetical protein LDENG_00023720 [Lucifuga dentata]